MVGLFTAEREARMAEARLEDAAVDRVVAPRSLASRSDARGHVPILQGDPPTPTSSIGERPLARA